MMDSYDRSKHLRAGCMAFCLRPALFFHLSRKNQKNILHKFLQAVLCIFTARVLRLRGLLEWFHTIPAALFFVFTEALKIPRRRNAVLLSTPKGFPLLRQTRIGLSESHLFFYLVYSFLKLIIAYFKFILCDFFCHYF